MRGNVTLNKKEMKQKVIKKNPAKSSKKRVRTISRKLNKRDLIALGIIAVAIIVGIIFLVRNIVITNMYSYYTDKMVWYGYDKLYDNEEAKSTETVLSDEIAKMVSGVLYNKTNKDSAKNNIFTEDKDKLSVNEAWIEFAKSIPISEAGNITLGKKASKLQVAKMIIQGIERVYLKQIEITEPLNEKYRKNFSQDELDVIDKAISLGILKNSLSDVKKEGMIKGELNKMLIIASEKYSMVYYKNINVSDTVASLVTAKDKLPKNSDIYPYVIDSIPTEIYEIEMPEMQSSISVNPKETYYIYHEKYDDTERNLVNYFNTILNVDYRTIDGDTLIEKINPYVAYNINSKVGDNYQYKETIEKYVEYVKENNIVLSGKVTPQLPIVYSNGMIHYVRCKIDFEVVESKTNQNLLLWDKGVTYNKNKVSVYTDIAVSPTQYSKAFRLFNEIGTMQCIVKDSENAITVK